MCMKETLVRRFRYLVEVSEKNPFGPAPDLVLMDGGSNQVAVAVEVLNAYGLDIPVYGLVKDNKHRTRGIITPYGEELIIEDKDIMNFITFIQDEVHRTAIEYHRKLRDKKMKVSILDDIPGVGDKRKGILLKKYKSLKKISEASLDELESVEGIDEKTAKAVFDFFHN